MLAFFIFFLAERKAWESETLRRGFSLIEMATGEKLMREKLSESESR